MDSRYNSNVGKEILTRLGYSINSGKTKFMLSCLEHEDKHPSFSVDIEKNMCHCFSCGFGSSLTSLYYNKFGKSIYREMGLNNSQDYLSIPKENKIDFSQELQTDFVLEGRKLPLTITEASKIWIKQRGFTDDLLKSYGAFYIQSGITKKQSDLSDKSNWVYIINRMVFPVYENGKSISYELRDVMGKTHYEKQLQKKGLLIDNHPYKKILYPKNSSINTLYDNSKLNQNETLYIVEGLMDLISLRTHPTFKNSTCLFHCIPTERQFFLLNKFKKIVMICDNDLPGLMGCKKLMERNNNTSFLTLPENIKDVNEILQKRDKRYSSIDELITKYNWLSYIKSSMRDLNSKIKKLENKQ